jgi:hypothetical protein
MAVLPALIGDYETGSPEPVVPAVLVSAATSVPSPVHMTQTVLAAPAASQFVELEGGAVGYPTN